MNNIFEIFQHTFLVAYFFNLLATIAMFITIYITASKCRDLNFLGDRQRFVQLGIRAAVYVLIAVVLCAIAMVLSPQELRQQIGFTGLWLALLLTFIDLANTYWLDLSNQSISARERRVAKLWTVAPIVFALVFLLFHGFDIWDDLRTTSTLQMWLMSGVPLACILFEFGNWQRAAIRRSETAVATGNEIDA